MVSISQVSRVDGAPRTLAQNRAVHRRWLYALVCAHSSVTAREPSPRASNRTSRSGGQPFLAHDAINSRARQPHYLGQDVQTHGDHAQGLT